MNTTLTAETAPAHSGLDLDRVPWGAVVTFIAIACGLAWVIQLPVWLSGEGLTSPLFLPLTAAMMFTPTIAALIVTFFILKPRHKARFLGLTMPRVGRSIWLIVIWPIFFTLLGFAAFFLAAAVAWVEPDFTVSGLTTALAEQNGPSLGSYLVVSYALMHVAMLSATTTAFGEELGWRGFLVPATAALGFWKGTLFRGTVWGIWHAPVILLGYNFMRPDALGLLAMCGFTITLGVFLDWSRYVTKSMWAAAFGHGAINAVATSTLIFAPADGAFDPLFATVLGFPGWIVSALVIGVMLLVGAFRSDRLLPLIPLPKRKDGQQPTDDTVQDAGAPLVAGGAAGASTQGRVPDALDANADASFSDAAVVVDGGGTAF